MGVGGKKNILIGVGVLVVLIIAGIFFVLPSAGPNFDNFATAISVNGDVVQLHNGQEHSLEELQKLSVQDTIETNLGDVTLSLFNRVLVDVEPQTVLELIDLSKETMKVQQLSGSTFSSFKRLLGVETLEIQTPNALASVRGTGFEITVEGNDTVVIVDEGTVDVNGTAVQPFEKVRVTQNGEVLFEELTLADLERTLAKRERMLATLEEKRWNLINNAGRMVTAVRKSKNIDDAKVAELLADIDAGKITEQAIRKSIPIKTKVVDRFLFVNAQIKDANEAIQRVNERIANEIA